MNPGVIQDLFTDIYLANKGLSAGCWPSPSQHKVERSKKKLDQQQSSEKEPAKEGDSKFSHENVCFMDENVCFMDENVSAMDENDSFMENKC